MRHPIQYLSLFITLFFFLPLYAKLPVDVYGTDTITATYLLKKYGQRIATIEHQLMGHFTIHGLDTSVPEALLLKRAQLINKIKQDGPFAFIDLQTITYPEKKIRYYTTLEVVMSNQSERLTLVQKPTEQTEDKAGDIIAKMTEYDRKGGELSLKDQLNGLDATCPIYHCTPGFNHPQLKPYFDSFNQNIPNQKVLVLNTLNHDPNPERRASAAFLVGHFNNPQEIMNALIPHVNDPDTRVRNNVLRVIAATMKKSHITTMNLTPFIQLLNSPYATDRNKALCVLVASAETNKNKAKITQAGGDTLLALLQITQPINHNDAYVLLKKISGHDFGETSIDAWKQWLTQQTHSRSPVRHPESSAAA